MYHESQAEQEEPRSGGGIFRWLTDRWSPEVEDDEPYEEPAVNKTAPPATPRGSGTPRRDIRIAPAREGSISVMPVTSFGDVQRAADRLKAGEPQIINLERTPPEVSERLIDFLNGVTYALDGFVEKISEGAYLFTPSHIAIHADTAEAAAAQPKPFFDR